MTSTLRTTFDTSVSTTGSAVGESSGYGVPPVPTEKRGMGGEVEVEEGERGEKDGLEKVEVST